jgi:hypothetical protein
MLPRNVMEVAVRDALSTRAAAGADGGTCWCPVCTADMQALALSSLPPKYVTRRGERAVLCSGGDGAIDDTVDHAVRWVGHHPKHRPGAPAPPADQVALVNFTYETGFALIDERVNGVVGSCECFDCRCDAVAFALNRFPARYGVALGGQSQFPEDGRRQMGAELAPFIDLGLRVVASRPRHERRAADGPAAFASAP